MSRMGWMNHTAVGSVSISHTARALPIDKYIAGSGHKRRGRASVVACIVITQSCCCAQLIFTVPPLMLIVPPTMLMVSPASST